MLTRAFHLIAVGISQVYDMATQPPKAQYCWLVSKNTKALALPFNKNLPFLWEISQYQKHAYTAGAYLLEQGKHLPGAGPRAKHQALGSRPHLPSGSLQGFSVNDSGVEMFTQWAVLT